MRSEDRSSTTPHLFGVQTYTRPTTEKSNVHTHVVDVRKGIRPLKTLLQYSSITLLERECYEGGSPTLSENGLETDDDDDRTRLHQTDTACSWLVCHSATVGGTVRGNTVQIVSTYPASPEARPPSFLGKPAVRSRSMAGGAPTPCGRH